MARRTKTAPEAQESPQNQKTIRIACEGAGTIEMDALTEFQGNLKALSEQSYLKLRSSILTLGFSFPIFAWRSDKTYVIDAHQRITVLKRMRNEEGFEIPKLPVVWIEASSRQEAARKLLAATSQYGEITGDGLFEYLNEFKLELPEVSAQFQFPEIDFDRFASAYFPQVTEVTFKAKQKTGSKELDASEFECFAHECPKCGFKFDEG